MTTLREAAQQALEALEVARLLMQPVNFRDWRGPRAAAYEQHGRAITALRTALSESDHIADVSKLVEQRTEPEQEPVAWMCADEDLVQKGYSRFSRTKEGAWNIPVYTHPVDDTALLRQVLNDLCGSRLCEVNSMSSREEAKRLIDKAITALRERLKEST